jgi:hypothetical protein
MLYNSNFDDSDFQKVNFREFNKNIDDPCTIQQRNDDNTKKLKFITTNHIDLLEAKEKLNFFGMTIKDHLFVPANKMDDDSDIRIGEKGNILTNCNIKNEYGQLPFPTMPYRGQTAHGDVKVEYLHLLEENKNSCNPRESNYHNRFFYIFDNKQGIETPNPLKSVEMPEFGPRGGISSRFPHQQ